MGQVQTGLGERSHGGHRNVLTLAQHVGDVGAKDSCNIAEHRDRHHISRQGRGQLQILAAEKADEEVGDRLGGASVLHAHGQHSAQNDGHTQAAQGVAKAGGNQGQSLHKGVPFGPKDTQGNTEA